jgi:mono/diheme cytochrome c family protein
MDLTRRQRKLKSSYLVLLLIQMAFLSGCYYDKVEALNPANGYTNPCDTAQHAIYSEAIQSIMSYNCSSCHNSSYTAGNVLLDSYDNVKKYAVNGMMMDAINRKSGTSPMPPTQALADCQTQKLVLWINDNYPQ